jgi:hypothetical protein
VIIGPAAVKRCGMLDSHAEIFAAVAARNNAVIGSRELNPLSEGLLREGHASKGFHIKAKSCDWGPMAGFVCSNPRFSKERDLQKQQRYIDKALAEHAGLVPLRISSKRLIELDGLGIINQQKQGITATRILICAASRHHGATDFAAVRVQGGEPIWKLYALTQPCNDVSQIPANLDADNSEEVNGMSNPPGIASAGPQPAGVHAAVAGDYDLFCVWPHHRHRHDRPLAAPPRPLFTGNPRFKARAEAYTNAVAKTGGTGKEEHPDMGNTSFYVEHIIRQLNDGIRHPGGNMVHHNDESSNPHTPGQDYPLLIFIPGQAPCAIENDHELRDLYQNCEAVGYAVERNLGFRL